jgi:glycosyltransferase involved in cell wall biosynthesis
MDQDMIGDRSPQLRVLQLGPLYNNHIRRWSQHAATLGCTVYAAGHVRRARRKVDLSGIADVVISAPESLHEAAIEPHVGWLRSVVDRLQPDLVQAHFLSRWPYVATLAGLRPLVVTPWGSDLYLAAGEARRRADCALHGADVVVALSAHMRRELLARGVPGERIEMADLGVDLERFRPASERPGDTGPPTILSFRAGTELYNLDVVLDAFRIVRRRVPDAVLVLVHGDAPLADKVQARLAEMAGERVVEVRGPVEHTDMADYMRSATVGVSIPRSDGSPSSVWEALATGLPVVLSRLPQLEERLGSAGAAVFVEPRADAVAAALIDVLERPDVRRRIARAARAWGCANMDERAQVARLGAIYARLAGRDRATRAAQPLRPS